MEHITHDGYIHNRCNEGYVTCIKCNNNIRYTDKHIKCDTGYYVHEGCDYRACQYCKGTIANSEVAVSCPTGIGHYVHNKC